jgi:hypothetical protein
MEIVTIPTGTGQDGKSLEAIQFTIENGHLKYRYKIEDGNYTN